MYRRAEDDQQRRRVAISFEKLVREGIRAPEGISRDDAPVVDPGGEKPARRFFGSAEADEPEAVESQLEMMRRIRGTGGPWVDRGVDPADGHAFSNVKGWSGSPAHPFTWPLIGPPSEPG
jgi:hypothetical protein